MLSSSVAAAADFVAVPAAPTRPSHERVWPAVRRGMRGLGDNSIHYRIPGIRVANGGWVIQGHREEDRHTRRFAESLKMLKAVQTYERGGAYQNLSRILSHRE